MTRISRSQLLLIVGLLSTLLLETSAFTSNSLSHSSVISRHHVRQFVAAADPDSTCPERLSINLPDVSNNVLEQIEESQALQKQSKLPWLMLLAALIQTHFFNSNTGADSVALSTVSATLLRTNRIPKWLSTQQLLAAGVLAWQLTSNLSNVLRLVQMTGSAFSVWYMSCLSAHPIYTKSLTSGIIGFVGDAGAQMLEERMRFRKEGSPAQFRKRFDRRRAWTNVVDGMFVTGPMLHFSYNFLESLLPVSGAASGLGASIAALTQVLIDDFILDGIFVGIMFITTGLGEGCKLRDIFQQIRKDYVGAVRMSWATSILVMPLEFMLFRFFPLSVRVLGMNFIDIIWEGMVSYLVHKRRRGHHMVEDVQGIPSMDTVVVPAQ